MEGFSYTRRDPLRGFVKIEGLIELIECLSGVEEKNAERMLREEEPRMK